MNAVDKGKVLKQLRELLDMMEDDAAFFMPDVNAIIKALEGGDFDIPETTVTLGDGTVAKVGDKVSLGSGGEFTIVAVYHRYRAETFLWLLDESNIPATGIANNCTAIAPEPDSWEKLETDAKVAYRRYWKCSDYGCSDCPVMFDGKTPYQRYDIGGLDCRAAMATELVYRAKALAGVE